MKRILIAIFAALSVSGTAIAQNANNLKVIEVSATAQKAVTPDEIFLNITINEKENKGKVSIEQQEKQMIKTLQDLGINVKGQLTIKNMGSSLKTYALKKDEIYAAKDYSLKLSSASTAYAAIDALNSIGISHITLGKTALSSKLQIETKDNLLAEATKKAYENAKIMASAVGSNAGNAIFLSNTYYFDSDDEEEIAFRPVTYNSAKTAASTEINIAKQTISMRVNAKFELLDE